MIAAEQLSSVPCVRCGGRYRHRDDLYHLIVPASWTLTDVRIWGDRGATIALLHQSGVRVDRLCLGCQTTESVPEATTPSGEG